VKSIAKIQNPDDVVVEMRISMTVKQWKQLKSQMSTNIPAWEFGSRISSLVEDVERHFFDEWVSNG